MCILGVDLMAYRYYVDSEPPLLDFQQFLVIRLAKFLLKIQVFCRLLVQKTLKKLVFIFQEKEQAIAVILRYCLPESVQ